jgi:hypothetical protein
MNDRSGVMASSHIDLPPAEVWPVLLDVRESSAWDSGVLSVVGSVHRGSRLAILSEVDPQRSFVVRVTRIEPPTRLELTGGLRGGLFRGVRTYSLLERAGGTDFRVVERYSGPMIGLIAPHVPDLQPSFERFALGLRDRVERHRPDQARHDPS